MSEAYEDIINLPHHVSERHPQMSMTARAAQFAPFAALAGHDAAIREAARETDEWTRDESVLDELDRTLSLLRDVECGSVEVRITCFIPDGRKTGGRYTTLCGRVKAVDDVGHQILLSDGQAIPFCSITDIIVLSPNAGIF